MYFVNFNTDKLLRSKLHLSAEDHQKLKDKSRYIRKLISVRRNSGVSVLISFHEATQL